MLTKIIRFFLENKLATVLLLIFLISWGLVTSPFNWKTGFLPSDPVPVDAIPDIGENQQIVYTEWQGRSPQDIEDQISYPLTTSLLGIPGVKSIRSNSIVGLSSIYIIFEEDIEFYWSRTRILEKLNSLPSGLLPEDAKPSLGPDATAVGQVFWYTLEGRDKDGKPNGNWDPHELRTIQDYYVRYALTAAEGVSEVASIGGFIKEYQIDIDPVAMKAYGVNLAQLMAAVKNSNLDVGARTIEFNRVEYIIRALGYIKSIEDIEKTVVALNNQIPVHISDVAKVSFGPGTRRGGLDKGGAEAVGGVIVARYGANPMQTIENVKAKIKEIEPGLPSKVLADGSVSKLHIVPFYDRSILIKETLGTLEEAITLELLISILVVIVLVFNLRASILISSLLPIGVLISFIVMRQAGVDANIVALSGIAIAIGVMVDVGVVFVENIIRHAELPENSNAKGKKLNRIIYLATSEVAGAVVTALATTIVSFLPVFALEAAEGKLFKPLAFTKTFTMLAALMIGLMIIPTLAYFVFSIRIKKKKLNSIANALLVLSGLVLAPLSGNYIALGLSAYGINSLGSGKWKNKAWPNRINIGITVFIVVFFLSKFWLPLGAQYSLFSNFSFVFLMLALILSLLSAVVYFYPSLLKWSLNNKGKFSAMPLSLLFLSALIWFGVEKFTGFLPEKIKESKAYRSINDAFPGLGREFMPALDEGSFLLMPTTMPHSGVEENLEVIRLLDKMINNIPEVEEVVGKWGRVSSALDPAPISMFENVINYKSEYILDENGRRMRFKVNKDGAFVLKDKSVFHPEKDPFGSIDTEKLIPHKNGKFFRQWRKSIQSPNDIWNEIVKHSEIPGLTSAPKLQPIETRLVMLQTGMRAPMGIKVFGPDLESIENTALNIEQQLKHVEGVSPNSVFADRMVGKPYLELDINRDALARYGISMQKIQSVIGSAIGGMELSKTVEGRERFPIRMRYARELRDNPNDIEDILIPASNGIQIPLSDLASITYKRGPQLIRSENTFLVAYIIFDKEEGFAEVDVVENAQKYLHEQIQKEKLILPAGVTYAFTGNYENQIRATERLSIVIPLSLLIVFLILYFQFKSISSTLFIFSGILVALAGGFLMIWLFGQSWFLNIDVFGTNLRNVFQVQGINLSVAVWVGFIALFGVATDDGVLITTYIKQLFDKNKPKSVIEIRTMILEAGSKRVRPAMMTTATTLIALLPVLSSTGKGSDIMIPMAIPLFGGMSIAILSIFVVPVLFSWWQELKIKREDNAK